MQVQCNNFTHELFTSVISEWVLYNQQTMGIIMFACPLGAWKSLFGFCTQVSWVTAVVWCCGDERIYGQFLLSEYASFIKHKSRLTIS